MRKTKIFVNRNHFASVQSDLLLLFRQKNGIINFQPWLRQTVYEEFGISLKDKESIDALEKALNDLYYDSIGEWLQYIMRKNVLCGKDTSHE